MLIELILSSVCVYVWVCVVCLSTFSNIFSSETTGPIEAKFYMEPSLDGGKKVCSNGLSQMTKMAAMPIYGKNLKNLLFRNQKAEDLVSDCRFGVSPVDYMVFET